MHVSLFLCFSLPFGLVLFELNTRSSVSSFTNQFVERKVAGCGGGERDMEEGE